MIDLKECPFCGHKTIDTTITPQDGYMQCYCQGCHARGPERLGDLAAKEAWNRQDGVDYPLNLPLASVKWNRVETATPRPNLPVMLVMRSGVIVPCAYFRHKKWLIPPVCLGVNAQGDMEWTFPPLVEDDSVLLWALHPEPAIDLEETGDVYFSHNGDGS